MTRHEAFEHHEHGANTAGEQVACRFCSTPYSPEKNPSRLGICEKCGYKILIVLLVVMVAASYVAWFGVL